METEADQGDGIIVDPRVEKTGTPGRMLIGGRTGRRSGKSRKGRNIGGIAVDEPKFAFGRYEQVIGLQIAVGEVGPKQPQPQPVEP
ncbi:MAG: hypothetical protein ACLT1W_10310, partial [Alistipes onderdonkii]